MNPARIPTPAYVYDRDEVQRCYHQLHSFLPRPSTILYSVKANPHPAIISALHQRGCHVEVASIGELAAALEAGLRAHDQVLFTAPAKRDSDLAAAMASDVGLFSVDSPYAIDQLNRIATARQRRVRFLLRVNDTSARNGARLAMNGGSSQFGADLDWIHNQPHLFTDRPDAEFAGLHFFAGSQVNNVADLIAQAKNTIGAAARLEKSVGKSIRILNLGGGFPAPYATHGTVAPLSGFGPQVGAHLDEHFPRWRHGTPTIAFESGRYLTASSGHFVVRVLEVKESDGKNIAVLESGINHLGGMSGLRRLPALQAELMRSDDREPAIDYRLVGPLCTPLDTLSTTARLPRLQAGDLLTIPNVGAYGLTASLVAFLSHPLPPEVIVEGGQITHMSTLTISRHQQGVPGNGFDVH